MYRMLFVVFLASLMIMRAYSEELPRRDDESFQHVVDVFKFHGLRHVSDSGLYFVFEVFTADPNRHQTIFVPPQNLRIAQCGVGQLGTTLNYNIQALPRVATVAQLNLPTATAVQSWENYIAKLRIQCDLVVAFTDRDIIVAFQNTEGLIATCNVQYRVTLPVVGSSVVAHVIVSLDHIIVMNDAQPTERIVVPWGGALITRIFPDAPSPESWYEIHAPRVEIRVSDEASRVRWENKIANWKAELQPHIVLPDGK